MRFQRPLDDLFGSRVRLGALRVLARSPAEGFTGRELARMCGCSPAQMISALGSLEETGVVNRRVAGRAHVWRLSTEHLLAKRLTDLFRTEADSIEALKTELRVAVRGLPVRRVTLFGSTARTEERPTSDIDFLVEVDSEAEKRRVEDALNRVAPSLAVKFGNPISPLILTRAQIRKPSNPSLLANILREGERVDR